MEIKPQDYSLISNEWIDQQLKQLEVYIDTHKDMSCRLTMMSIYNSMCYVKKQLIPSEKLVSATWDASRSYKQLDNGNLSRAYKFSKEDFLNSEIEIDEN